MPPGRVVHALQCACCEKHGSGQKAKTCAVPCRLLQAYITAARRHGARAHSIVSWVRRKLGADLVVIRQRSDGTFGSSVPCVYCLRELTRFDLRVHCTLDGGGVFSGRLTDSGAPRSTLTTGQRRMLGKE